LAITSAPTNTYGLYQYMAQRLPGYDPSEYLRELNSAYIHVWEEVTKLKNHYFTNQKTLTVVSPTNNFDLLYNANNALSGVLSNRLYQITRIRVQPPAGGLFQTSTAMHFNDPDYLSISANPGSTPSQTGPYWWTLYGRGNLLFGLPLQTGSVIEVTYTFWPISLTYLSNGTLTSVGQVITGTSTTFTQLVPPDFQTSLPLSKQQEEILAELIVNNSAVYQVSAITSDTALSTFVPIAPALAGATYVVATAPEIPREHIRVIASVAMAKMFSVDGDDARTVEWTGTAASNMQMMKDSLVERYSNNPPKKQRFPYGVGRRNRAFLR
jgi:hypothetical protein